MKKGSTKGGNKRKKKVVVMGGGTGSFVVLSGLKKYDDIDLTAIVSMADDGGSTGMLRDEYGVLPPGDVRQCLVALSRASDRLRELFNFRFTGGSLRGHNFGNIFISAIEKQTGDFNKALEVVGEILNVEGRVVPVTLDKVRLVAVLGNGKRIIGEGKLSNYTYISKYGIRKISFDKNATANKKAIAAIKDADVIVVGPGSFYSSLIPNFLVKGISQAFVSSKAKKIFVCNLMNKVGHTDNFSVCDFIEGIEKYIGSGAFDVVLFNTGKISGNLLRKYKEEGSPVLLKRGCRSRFSIDLFVGRNLVSGKLHRAVKGDMLKRTLIRHDPDKLARAIRSVSGLF